MWQAIRSLKVERIDHGVHSLEDPELLKYLKEHRIALTVCPCSNEKVSAESYVAAAGMPKCRSRRDKLVTCLHRIHHPQPSAKSCTEDRQRCRHMPVQLKVYDGQLVERLKELLLGHGLLITINAGELT